MMTANIIILPPDREIPVVVQGQLDPLVHLETRAGLESKGQLDHLDHLEQMYELTCTLHICVPVRPLFCTDYDLQSLH